MQKVKVCIVKRLKHFPFVSHHDWELSPAKQNQQLGLEGQLVQDHCMSQNARFGEGSEMNLNVLGNTSPVQARTGAGWGVVMSSSTGRDRLHQDRSALTGYLDAGFMLSTCPSLQDK